MRSTPAKAGTPSYRAYGKPHRETSRLMWDVRYRFVAGLSGNRLLVMSSPGVGVTSRGLSWVGEAWPASRCGGVLGGSGMSDGTEDFAGSFTVLDIASRL
jgi:hypothetical protein